MSYRIYIRLKYFYSNHYSIYLIKQNINLVFAMKTKMFKRTSQNTSTSPSSFTTRQSTHSARKQYAWHIYRYSWPLYSVFTNHSSLASQPAVSKVIQITESIKDLLTESGIQKISGCKIRNSYSLKSGIPENWPLEFRTQRGRNPRLHVTDYLYMGWQL